MAIYTFRNGPRDGQQMDIPDSGLIGGIYRVTEEVEPADTAIATPGPTTVRYGRYYRPEAVEGVLVWQGWAT